MGWLNKIFGGSSNRKLRAQQYHWKAEVNLVDDDPSCSPHGRSEDDTATESASTGSGCQSEDENDDLDQATTLSSSGDERTTNESDSSSDSEEDERLARSLEGSLHIQPPHCEVGHLYQPNAVNFSSGFRICAGCNTEVGFGRFLSCMNTVWHPECFRCHACNLLIYDYEFSNIGNRPYHRNCCKENYHPKCDVCKQFIPLNMNGLIEYRAHPFWQQKYCPSHDFDGTPRCCSCERLKPRDAKYVSHDDGRTICEECLNSAVMSTAECQPLYLNIKKFYEGLNMEVEQQIPLLLVERQALNDAMNGEEHGHHLFPETRGLCVSEEHIVNSIPRRGRVQTGNRNMDRMMEPYRHNRIYEVTAILLLYGLPRLLIGSILAHEMMHAWLRLSGLPTLSHEVEEGICQVLAHMWICSALMALCYSENSSLPEMSSGDDGRRIFERRFGNFVKHQIEVDRSAYGDGFRAGYHAVQRYGLRGTLDHIRMTGTFPY